MDKVIETLEKHAGAASLIEALRKAFPDRIPIIRRRPFKSDTQTALFGDSTKKPGEIDIILQRAVGVWAEGQALGFNISEPEERSDTVTAIVTRAGESARPLVDYCAEKCGVVLGRAIGPFEGKGFRIAHMGHVNAPMVLGTLAVVETALCSLGIPHGKGGSSAAIEYLAKAVPA